MRPEHWYEPGVIYHLITNTEGHCPLFRNEANARLVIEDMNFYRQIFSLEILLYVIMPDHFHWAILPSEEDFNRFRDDQMRFQKKYHESPEKYYLSKIMEDFERHTAFAINARENAKGRAVWQEGFAAKWIENRPAFETVMDYIHKNPIKAGLVQLPEEYAFSSYRSLFLEDHSVFRVDVIDWW